MKRPSFQFYPGDWKGNSKLRRCSEAARGAWVDVLCLLHDQDEYGVARFTLEEIARAAGVTHRSLRELVEKGVLKGSDAAFPAYNYTPHHAGKPGNAVTLLAAGNGPCWYSSRFIRDEWLRKKRGQSTRFSTDNQPTTKPTGGLAAGSDTTRPLGERQGDGASSSSSSSTTVSNTPRTRDSTSGNHSHPGEGKSTSTPRAAAHSLARTQAQIHEQRDHGARAAPMPEHLRKFVKPPAEPAPFNDHRSPFDEDPPA